MIPSTPNDVAGSPDPNPLITVARYQRITGDKLSTELAVTEALDDAIVQTEYECHRTWLYGQYTELLYDYPNGMVYPSACPLDSTKPVISGDQVFDPAGENSASVVQGAGVWVGWFTPLPFMPVWTGVIPPQTEITYWGGYKQSTVPPNLARMWARIAYFALHPVVLQGLPGGAKAVSMGGVSMSGDLSGMITHDPATRRLVKRFTRPQWKAWET